MDASLWHLYAEMVRTQIERTEQADHLTIELPDTAWTGIVFLGDLHIGGLIDTKRLEADIAVVASTPGLYAVGMGDYGEHFDRSGKILHAMSGDVLPSSEDQEAMIQYVLSPITDWLAILAGNHDDWGGPGAVTRLAEKLGAAYVSQAGCSLTVELGIESYHFYLKHQYPGGGRANSNDGKRLWAEWPDFRNADVTVLAHLHEPNTHSVERKDHTVHHLRGGTYKLVDPWARKGGYCPAYGPPLVLLNPVEHMVIPFHGPLWRAGVRVLSLLRRGDDEESYA